VAIGRLESCMDHSTLGVARMKAIRWCYDWVNLYNYLQYLLELKWPWVPAAPNVCAIVTKLLQD